MLSDQRGFTLLEVVVAIVIITTLVATFGPLIVSSVERIVWAGQRTQELYEIRSIMEKSIYSFAGEYLDELDVKGNNKKATAKGKIIKGPANISGDFITFISSE